MRTRISLEPLAGGGGQRRRPDCRNNDSGEADVPRGARHPDAGPRNRTVTIGGELGLMRGKPLHSLWPMAVLLAAMIGAVGLATARRADGAGKATAGVAR